MPRLNIRELADSHVKNCMTVTNEGFPYFGVVQPLSRVYHVITRGRDGEESFVLTSCAREATATHARYYGRDTREVFCRHLNGNDAQANTIRLECVNHLKASGNWVERPHSRDKYKREP